MAKKQQSIWESMTIEELFTLRELMQEVLEAKAKRRRAELERQLRALGQRPMTAEPKPVLVAVD